MYETVLDNRKGLHAQTEKAVCCFFGLIFDYSIARNAACEDPAIDDRCRVYEVGCTSISSLYCCFAADTRNKVTFDLLVK